MIKSIIFLAESPFNLRDFRRFGIELLQENGFEVEIWDITLICCPNLHKKYVPPDPFNCKELIIFDNEIELYRRLSTLKKSTFVVNMGGYEFDSFGVYRALSKSKAEYALTMANAFPDAKKVNILGLANSYLKKIKKMFKLTPEKLLDITKVFLAKIPPKLLSIKAARLVLAGGGHSLVYACPIDSKSEILWAHTLDYDLYLEERKTPSAIRPMAVFLDEYLPFHPDYIRLGCGPPISSKKYYPLLDNFFNRVEKELNLKVVIAAHPRSHYENLPEYFRNRKSIRGQTIKLVKESQLVLTHASTAVNFANLYHKPVVFLTCSELNKGYYGPVIREMANWFGKSPVVIGENNEINWEAELTVSDEHYENYRQSYIKTENSEDLPFWQIVANRLKSFE